MATAIRVRRTQQRRPRRSSSSRCCCCLGSVGSESGETFSSGIGGAASDAATLSLRQSSHILHILAAYEMHWVQAVVEVIASSSENGSTRRPCQYSASFKNAVAANVTNCFFFLLNKDWPTFAAITAAGSRAVKQTTDE